MKKAKRFLSVVISAVITVLAFSTTFVSASEIEKETRLLTLKQLLAMSDEEFLSLNPSSYAQYPDYGKSYYNNTPTTFQGFFFMANAGLEWSGYTANVTEQDIDSLLKDSGIKYEIESPALTYMTGYNCFNISNDLEIILPDYKGELTSSQRMVVAKTAYCINQVITVYSKGNSNCNPEAQSTTIGDVNLDLEVDVFDAIYIARHTVGIYKFSDKQVKIGDVTGDGECDIYDAIEIAQGKVK